MLQLTGLHAYYGKSHVLHGVHFEVGEGEIVLRKVPGRPVEQHADALGVAALDEAAETLGAAEAGGRRVQADGLVAPGAVEGMLGDGQQLDVREAQPGGIARQRGGQGVPVHEVGGAPAGRAAPGRRMDLVDADRGIAPVHRAPVHGQAHLRRLFDLP